jgi:hypothetical protein
LKEVPLRRVCFRILLAILFLAMVSASPLFAQDASSETTVSCNLDPDKQLAVEYQRLKINPKKPVFGREIPYGKVWAPGGKPMTLFTTTPVTIGGKALPVGAYTMFVLPTQKQWTLIISKSTDMSGKYDDQQDLVRVPMESGELPSAENEFSVYFAHEAPTRCSMRLDLEKVCAWVIFQQGTT